MTPREALDRIAALCNDADETNGGLRGWVLAGRVRAVLAEVSPEPGGDMQSPLADHRDMQSFGPGTCTSGGVLDGDALWAIYDRYSMPNDVQEERGLGFDAFVQEVEAAVRPAAIDRDALDALLFAFAVAVQKRRSEGEGFDIRPWLDRFLALVRPAAGVTLTPEDAARTLLWWAVYREEGFPGITDAALVARLEAAQ